MIPASFFEDLTKTAEEERQDDRGKRYLQALKHVGMGLGGLGVGIAAGKGTGHLIGKLTGGAPVPGAGAARWILPAATGAAGLSYSLWKSEEAERMRRALQDPRE